MNNYTYEHNDVKVKNYCCIKHFLESVANEIIDSGKDFTSTTVVANGELTQDLIRLILTIPSEQLDTNDYGDDFLFHMGMINFNSIEYDGEYYISMNTDFEVWCEPAWHEDGGYYTDEADYTYVYEDSDYKILDKVESDDVTIFGFED